MLFRRQDGGSGMRENEIERRPLQIKRMRQLKSLGFPVYVVDGAEQIGGVLDEICAT